MCVQHVDARRVGRARGTSTCPGTALTSGFVTAMTMMNDAVRRFDEKNFSPLITHSSPSRSARQRNCVGSEPPCGSVIE